MATIKLNNGTRKNSVVGQLVRVDPNNPRNFIAVDINDLDVIGTIAEVKSPGNEVMKISSIKSKANMIPGLY